MGNSLDLHYNFCSLRRDLLSVLDLLLPSQQQRLPSSFFLPCNNVTDAGLSEWAICVVSKMSRGKFAEPAGKLYKFLAAGESGLVPTIASSVRVMFT